MIFLIATKLEIEKHCMVVLCKFHISISICVFKFKKTNAFYSTFDVLVMYMPKPINVV